MNYRKISTLLIAFSAVLCATAQPTVLPGEVNVSAVGAATYVVPIEVVPGTNGLQPNLAITYNSMAGSGVVGQKWGLQGISSISRVPQSRFFDGNILPIAFDTTDRFALDGNRMLLLSGTSYHDIYATYCFETEDFSRIVRDADADGLYFRQTLADGTIVEYGHGGHSQYMLDDGICMAWMVSKIIDIHGNYMTYKYKQSDGEIWISQIDYTFLNDNTPSYAQVVFDYVTMAAPNDGFVSGHKVRQSKLLKEIRVLYQNQQVRKYVLSYNTDLQSERLSSIRLCGSTNQVLTNTAITYETPASTFYTDVTIPLISGGYYAVPGNYTNDRLYDLFLVENDGSTYSSSILTNSSHDILDSSYSITNTFLPTTAFAQMNACDIDGDRIDEVICSSYNTVHAINMTGITNTPSNTLLFGIQNPSVQLLYGDFDGDGITEIVSFDYLERTLYSYGIEGITNTQITLSRDYRLAYAGDFDGDGKTDIMFNFGLVDDIFTYNLSARRWELVEMTMFPSHTHYSIVGDFNGDGMSDMLFLQSDETTWKVAIRQGNANWAISSVPDLDGTHEASGNPKPMHVPLILDLNGDGKSDILQPFNNNGTAKYIISLGCYNNSFRYSGFGTMSLASGQTFRQGSYSMGDFDGNGIADLVFCSPAVSGQAGSVKYFNKDRFPAYYANNIVNSAGMEVKLEYSTISLMPYRYYGTEMNRVPLPLVKNLIVSNGLHGYDTTSYYYGNAQYDAEKQRFLGFSLFVAKNRDMVSKSFFSRLYNTATTDFAMLVPDSVANYLSDVSINIGNNHYIGLPNGLLPFTDRRISKTSNTYRSVSRVNADGNVTFMPFVESAVEYDYLKNNKTTRQTTLNSDNWRMATLAIKQGYITGSDDEPMRQNDTYSYLNVIQPNGTLVVKPKKTITIHYNNISNANARLDTTEYTYSSNGMLSAKRHTDNGGMSVTESYVYNNIGLPSTVTTTPLGATAHYITFSYDPTYRYITSKTDHAGNTTQKTYNPATGLCLSETDINGLVTQYSHDEYGRPTQTIYPDATTKTFVYNDASTDFVNSCSHTTIVESGRPETRTYFDYIGRKTHTYVAGQGYMDVVYNSKGQVTKQTEVPYSSTSVTDASKKWKEFVYDDFGRVISEESYYTENTYSYRPDNSDYRYNERVVNKLGAETTKYYDAAGRMSEVEDEGGTITYSYDRVNINNIVRDRTRISMGGNTTVIVADSRGNRLQLTDPDAGTITATYNAWNELLTQTDANGNVTTMAYDNQGRMTSKGYSDGNTSETFSYIYGTSTPSKGKVTQVCRDNMYYQSFIYDNIGRLSSATKRIDGTDYTHSYTYNNIGLLYTTTFPSGYILRNEYDSYGRLKNLINHTTNDTIYTVESRNGYGQPNICWFGNNTGVEYSYNTWGLTTMIKVRLQGHNNSVRPVRPLRGG